MARIQLLIPDEDRDRFIQQAQREGRTLSAWLRTATRERRETRQRSGPFQSSADLEEFSHGSDELEGPESEPEWNEHLDVIAESRRRGAYNT